MDRLIKISIVHRTIDVLSVNPAATMLPKAPGKPVDRVALPRVRGSETGGRP
jgi:hypothetical protein